MNDTSNPAACLGNVCYYIKSDKTWNFHLVDGKTSPKNALKLLKYHILQKLQMFPFLCFQLAFS